MKIPNFEANIQPPTHILTQEHCNVATPNTAVGIFSGPDTHNAEDLKTCTRILDVYEYHLIKKTRLTYNQQILRTMDHGLVRKNQESYSLIEKENGKLMDEIQDLEGELTPVSF
ncbi:hypothetical protein TNCV_3112031 [Trichonephila clavipes]|nr:hypothetical protein TNCV_3112031 [Trichonephila clavipes]